MINDRRDDMTLAELVDVAAGTFRRKTQFPRVTLQSRSAGIAL